MESNAKFKIAGDKSEGENQQLMKNGRIADWGKYDFNSPQFQTAIAFLERSDIRALPDGWIELENGVRASIQRYQTAPQEMLSYESHDRHIDIQYLVDGIEWLGCADRSGMTVKTPYQAADDVTLYEAPSLHGGVLLHGGEYVIFTPEDAHQPRCQAGESCAVLKIVIKIPV